MGRQAVETAYAENAGFPIYWEERGPKDAPPLMLIMGMGFSSRAWEGLPSRLAKDYRVITLDNRWTGRSRPSASSVLQRFQSRMFRMAELADDAAAVLTASGGSAYVFGVSMGGMIAQELVLRHPERVKALALGATFADYAGADHPRLNVMIDLFLASAMPGPEQRLRLGRHLVSEEFLRTGEDRFARWLKNAEFGGRRLALAQMAAVMGHRTSDRLPNVSVPTLVLTGDDDRLVPPSNSQTIAGLVPSARLELLRGAGHVFPLEREDDTVRLLSEHFRA
jgi:pimeloyl-ACP methyl ester carboxylesterase